ncbi:unnamed protein product [Ectocarpus sp. CCAP 1310/34]|nr:unnamed protein product [Ectocarpus sp. CCAP 1310/34]
MRKSTVDNFCMQPQRKRSSGDLPVLSGEDTVKCTVLEAAGDGNCSLHSIYRLLYPERDSVVGATPEEITETHQEMVEMAAVAFTEDYGQLLANTVSEEEMLRLSNLNFDKGFYRKRTSSSGRATRRQPVKTVREVVEDIHKQLGYDYLAVCQLLALVAEVKECNIVVWEAKAGGGLRIVEIGETMGCFVGNLFEKDFLHLVNVAETKLNHFSAIVIPQELVPWALPYMLARGSSGESGFGHRKAADDICPCPTTSDKPTTKHRGSPIALDTDDDDETEINSSVRFPCSAGGARSVTTAPTGVSKPEAPPGKAAIKPATLPSASSMSATTGANETPTPAETPTKLASSKAQELSPDAAKSETLEGGAAGRCGAEAKSPCGMLCSMHSNKGGQTRTCGRGENGGDDETEYVQNPDGYEEMSDGGSDGEIPGDLADYDEPSEGWGKAALKVVFELVQHIHDFQNDRKVRMCALIFLGFIFFGKHSPLSGVMCCRLGRQRQHESYRGRTSFGEISSLMYTEC